MQPKHVGLAIDTAQEAREQDGARAGAVPGGAAVRAVHARGLESAAIAHAMRNVGPAPPHEFELPACRGKLDQNERGFCNQNQFVEKGSVPKRL